MTGKYHAYIIDDNGDFKVRPAVAVVDKTVSKDDKNRGLFTIRNLTGLTAVVTFASRRMAVPGRVPPFRASIAIPPGNVGNVPIPVLASGWYPYEVSFTAGGRVLPQKARGESGPGMIVDP